MKLNYQSKLDKYTFAFQMFNSSARKRPRLWCV